MSLEVIPLLFSLIYHSAFANGQKSVDVIQVTQRHVQIDQRILHFPQHALGFGMSY